MIGFISLAFRESKFVVWLIWPIRRFKVGASRARWIGRSTREYTIGREGRRVVNSGVGHTVTLVTTDTTTIDLTTYNDGSDRSSGAVRF